LNTPPAPQPADDLDDYLRGGSPLSRDYKREIAPMPPHALDRRVLRGARAVAGKSQCLAPLALAASVLLSVALVLAIVFGPQASKRVDDVPRLVRIAARAEAAPDAPLGLRSQLYSSDPPHARPPTRWLADISALRRAGRNSEADAELRRFRRSYPDYPLGAAQPQTNP
jgi:hypothetical protein